MNVNIKNLNLSVIMPAITKSSQPVCNDRVPSKEDKVERTSGLYLIYEDGHAEPFTGDNSKDCVRYIGLKHGYMSFAISLTEHDSVQLLDDDSREESGSGTYYERAQSFLSSSIIKTLFMFQQPPLFCPAINRLFRSFRDQPNTSHFHSTGDTSTSTIIICPTRCHAPLFGGPFQCHIVHFAPPQNTL